MDIKIQKAKITDIDLLMKWRMKVLHEVLSIPREQPMKDLERENQSYYEAMLPTGGHIACFSYLNGEIVGSGGICIY